jgi:hypothetical protein
VTLLHNGMRFQCAAKYVEYYTIDAANCSFLTKSYTENVH